MLYLSALVDLPEVMVPKVLGHCDQPCKLFIWRSNSKSRYHISQVVIDDTDSNIVRKQSWGWRWRHACRWDHRRWRRAAFWWTCTWWWVTTTVFFADKDRSCRQKSSNDLHIIRNIRSKGGRWHYSTCFFGRGRVSSKDVKVGFKSELKVKFSMLLNCWAAVSSNNMAWLVLVSTQWATKRTPKPFRIILGFCAHSVRSTALTQKR